MSTIHPHPLNEVKVDIEKQPKPSTKQSDEKPTETLKPYSYQEIFKVIVLCIFVYIVACELFSFGMKHIYTTSKDTILYRYHMIGSGLMVGVGFLGILFVIFWPFYWLQDKPLWKICILIEYHCTQKDESSSISWWQKRRFAKFILVICILIFWLTMFEIGHLLYIIADYIKDKPIWNHSMVYFIASAMLFGGWSLVLALFSCGIIMEIVVE